jgi:hypothetical protein
MPAPRAQCCETEGEGAGSATNDLRLTEEPASNVTPPSVDAKIVYDVIASPPSSAGNKILTSTVDEDIEGKIVSTRAGAAGGDASDVKKARL